jgi:hypothetical protein
MSIRREPTYLSREVWRSLWLIAKSKGQSEVQAPVTADEMADQLLHAVIKSKYPQLLEHQRAIDRMEKELLKTLGQ